MEKPHLNIPKRTKSLDDAKPVILSTNGTVDGTVWTTRGEKEMQPSDNEQLIANIAASKVATAVEKITISCLEQAAHFFEVTVKSMLPGQLVLGDEATLRWMAKEGVELHQDGLRSIVKRGGKVIADCKAAVPAQWHSLVEARLRQIQRQTAEGAV